MNVRTSARQYANALFDVAAGHGLADRVQQELAEFASLVSSHEELARVLTDRRVPGPAKAAVIRALSERAGLARELQRLLLWLADRDRLSLLPEIESAFSARVLDRAKVVKAEVTTTTGLPEEARGALQQALSRALGLDVQMTERVDPAIVGGIVARVGSVVFDGSVTRQIERVRERLLAGR
jgi:F-type H+-transporting ATPase subunit delta